MGLSPIIALAYRDLMKFVRDPTRIIASLLFPAIFIGVLGGSFQSGLGDTLGYNFLSFVFVGVVAQTLFQSSAMGIISIIEDRQNDFMQEVFVSPISRYSIVLGKIVGETLVSMTQGVAVVLFGLVLGISITPSKALGFLWVGIIICLFGGAFGVLVLSNLKSQRAANQIFPFIMLPQIFLAGVFTPIQNLPWLLDILSRISPMRYAVDLARGMFYTNSPEYQSVVLSHPVFNLTVIFGLFAVFVSAGTWLFVRHERGR